MEAKRFQEWMDQGAMSSVITVYGATAHPGRVVDQADLLTDQEEAELSWELDSISEELNFDVVVVSVSSLNGETIQTAADDFFDEQGYGMGNSQDGALLMLAMEERQWYVSTSGTGIDYIDENDLDEMENRMVEHFSEGNYLEGFLAYADSCREAVEYGGISGHGGNGVSLFWIPGSLLIGFVLAFLVTKTWKDQLKSVHYQKAALSYVEEESKKVTKSQDQFLYHVVVPTPRPKQQSGNSHVSSSGHRHGGGGGRF
ncbi:MAG: TPM domain-containing protein [Clostridiales bacterium]|nr:TPM domain-containing protein [Clostridiales bacterium]